jgi:hypothetical protein
MDKRIQLFVGPIGSGKTEISINYALSLKQEGENVALLDFDVVKPYIRVRDVVDQLSQSGLKVLTPEGPTAYADMPVVPAHIYHWIADTSRKLIMDVGGDKQGSTTIAQVIARLDPQDYEFTLVINPFRPFMSSVSQIIKTASEIAFAAHGRFTSIVANPHLKELTTLEDFLSGLEVVIAASKEMNLPIMFSAITPEMNAQLNGKEIGLKKLPLQLFVKAPWEEKQTFRWIYKG